MTEMNAAPTREEVRAAIASGMCWCGAGPFVAVALHSSKAHGVFGFDLRDIGGFLAGDSITSDEAFSARRREISKQVLEGRRGRRPSGLARSDERRTEEGKARSRARDRDYHARVVASAEHRARPDVNERWRQSVSEGRRGRGMGERGHALREGSACQQCGTLFVAIHWVRQRPFPRTRAYCSHACQMRARTEQAQAERDARRRAARVGNLANWRREIGPEAYAEQMRNRAWPLLRANEKRRKIPIEDYERIRNRLGAGESLRSIAAEYGCSTTLVRYVRDGKPQRR